MNREYVKNLIDKVFKFSTSDETHVTVSTFERGSTRVAENTITQNVYNIDTTLNINVAFGNQKGFTILNDSSDESLKSAVKRAEEMARVSPPDPEYISLPEPAAARGYRSINSFCEYTRDFGPWQRASIALDMIKHAEKNGIKTAGNITNGTWSLAVGNSRGLFACHEATFSRLICTYMTETSSGWAEQAHEDVRKLDIEKAFETAARKALDSRNPQEIKPGKYTVILEPSAVAELLSFMLYNYWAKPADQGVSFMSRKKGMKIFGDNFTFRTEPGHPEVPGKPFDYDGLPHEPVTFIKNGIPRILFCDRFWAKKTGVPPASLPGNAIVDGGGYTADELIAATEKGLLLTRIWYVRYVEPMNLLITGMTRDGTFFIEDGRIKHGLKNMRFNDSPLNVFSNIEMLGKQERTGEYYQAYMPWMRIGDFNFTSLTKF